VMSGLAVAVASFFHPHKAMAAAKQSAGDWTSPGLAAPEVTSAKQCTTDGMLQLCKLIRLPVCRTLRCQSSGRQSRESRSRYAAVVVASACAPRVGQHGLGQLHAGLYTLYHHVLSCMQELVEGTGPTPQNGDTVLIDYVLRRPNGYFIYSTVSWTGAPVLMPAG
jgi:hypothetical protein